MADFTDSHDNPGTKAESGEPLVGKPGIQEHLVLPELDLAHRVDAPGSRLLFLK